MTIALREVPCFNQELASKQNELLYAELKILVFADLLKAVRVIRPKQTKPVYPLNLLNQNIEILFVSNFTRTLKSVFCFFFS